MRKCARCGADTVIEEEGVPVCVKCLMAEDEEREERKPRDRETTCSPTKKPGAPKK
jgi:hypothetical protein